MTEGNSEISIVQDMRESEKGERQREKGEDQLTFARTVRHGKLSFISTVSRAEMKRTIRRTPGVLSFEKRKAERSEK